MKRLYQLCRDELALCLLGAFIGLGAGCVDTLFGLVMNRLVEIRSAHLQIFLPLLGLAGAGMLYCYQRFGGPCRRGMALIFETAQGKNPQVPFKLLPFAVGATWITQLFGGSAGREGVAVQIGGTIGSAAGRFVHTPQRKKTLLVAGMAAGFAGLFLTPMAAAFFALEVLSVGKIQHRSTLPVLTASWMAYFVSGRLGLVHHGYHLSGAVGASWQTVGAVILLGLAFGLLGRLFCMALHAAEHLGEKWIKNPLLRILIVGTGAGLLMLVLYQGRYAGLGGNLIDAAMSGKALPWDFVLKILFSVLCISVGFQGGEVMTLFASGATLGRVLGPLLGLPAPFAAALGYVAVFGSGTNTLMAPILIGCEVFGPESLPWFLAVAWIAYSVNGNHAIYKLQEIAD
ncbi:MAG: chloride channel protein [Clostridia bacterium]|nr:chloride channel protein [Clostridia bacterium]